MIRINDDEDFKPLDYRDFEVGDEVLIIPSAGRPYKCKIKRFFWNEKEHTLDCELESGFVYPLVKRYFGTL